jgi:hypothetical protein
VIHDVDEALGAIIRTRVVNGSGVDVNYEVPSKDWSTRRTVPTINVYLYDIREDTERRQVFYEDIRDDTGTVVERRQPPRRFKLSYLLTVWTQRPEDEHKLLAALLTTFLESDLLPDEVQSEALRSLERPIIVSIGLPLPASRSVFDMWTALGSEPKPSLDLEVIVPIGEGRSITAGPPVTEQPRLGFYDAASGAFEGNGAGDDEAAAAGGQRGGRRRGGAAAGAGAGADADSGGTGAAAAARAPSPLEVEMERLEIPRLSADGRPLTMGVRLGLLRTARERERREEAGALAAQDETIASGARGQPGRIFRIRTIPDDEKP